MLKPIPPILRLTLASVLSSVILTGCATAQPVGGLEVDYKITGAVQQTGSVRSQPTEARQCSSPNLPAIDIGGDGQTVESPPGPPAYLVQYDWQGPADQPGLFLKAFAYKAGVLTYSDPADDYVQINAGGRRWFGHGAGGTFDDRFTLAADGASGRLVAHGLRPRDPDASTSPAATIDVDITWRCRGS